MKFPRNARIFRGQLDAAPFVTVLFLLVIFLMLGTLVYTPGVRLQLPVADNLPGTDKPALSVAIDANGRYYFRNQLMAPGQLKTNLQQVVKLHAEPLTLVVQADKAVSYEQLLQLTLLARDAGIADAWLATMSRPFSVLDRKP